MAQTIKLKRSATAGAAPTTSQLELGEVAINTYDGKMYIKKSVGGTESIVELGSGLTPADAILEEYLYTATASQTAFSGNDDNSSSLSYVSGALQVFLNGILLDPETDYTATNGATITLTAGAALNDYLQIFAFKKKIGDSSITINSFTGNNSTTAYTLTLDPGDENNTRVFIDGVYQSKSNYTVSGTTLTFSSAPPSGTGIEVEIGNRAVSLDTASNLDLPDNVKLRLGTSQDLEIYHDASNSYINDTGAGALFLKTNYLAVAGANGNQLINAEQGAAVELYHNNQKKLETTSTGISVTGSATIAGLNITSTSSFSSTATFADGAEVRLGADNDMGLFHSSGVSHIRVNSGTFKLRADDMRFTAQNGTSEFARFESSGNLLIGTTDTTLWNDSADNYGHNILSNGQYYNSTNGEINVYLNRQNSDGAILAFAKDGSQVGTIGSNSARFYIHNNYGSGSGLRFDNASIRPSTSVGASEDNTTDLGASGARFKDLFLGGTISSGTITTTGELRGPASFTIDPAAVGDNTGTVIIKGNLQVDGATTTINSTTLTVDDLNLTLASGAANGTAANGAGITVDGASATITYNSTGDSWNFNKDIDVAGTGTFSGSVTSTGLTTSGNFLKTGTNGNYTIAANGNDFYYGRNGTNYHIANTANGAFQFLTGSSSTEALRITSAQHVNIANGKLGIGFTSTPDTALHVETSADTIIKVEKTGGNYIQLHGTGAGGRIKSDGQINFDVGSNSGALNLASNGNATFSGSVTGGAISGTSLSIDNLTINGYEIDSDTDFIIDAVGDINLDADGGDIRFKDGGAEFYKVAKNGDHVQLFSTIQDGDLTFNGFDGSSHIVALTLDMSEAGKASFNAGAYFPDSVGIGAPTPTTTLDLTKTSDTAERSIRIENSSARLLVGVEGTSANRFVGSAADHAFIGTTTNDGLEIGTNNNVRMVINTSGKVGIGTATPQHKLDTVGTVRHTSNIVSNTVYKAFSIGSNRTINDYGGLNKDYWAIQLATPGASTDGQSSGHAYGALKFSGVSGSDTTLDDVLVLNYNGNVGIGTDSPAALLHLKSTANSVGPSLIFENTNNAQSMNIDYWNNAGAVQSRIQYEEGPASWNFIPNTSNNNSALYIAYSGNIGIGTDSPSFPLHINKGTSNYAPTSGVNENVFGINTSYDAAGTQGITLSRLDGNWIDGTSGVDSAYGWLFGYQSAVRGGLVYDHRGSERMQLFSSYGALAFITPNAADGNGVPTDSNMVERLTILPGGNVGIGTTTPSTNLHVHGADATIRISGDNSMALHQDAAWNSNMYFGAYYDGSNTVYGQTGRGAFRMVNLHDGDVSPQYIAFYGANAGTAGNTVSWNDVGLAMDEDGKVGIGTTAPGSPLTIYNDSTAGNTQLHVHNDKTGDAAVLRLEGKRTSTNDNAQILFANNGSIGSTIRSYSGGDNGDIRFYTSSTGTGNTTSEALRITTAGDISVISGKGLYFGGGNRSTSTNAQAYIKESGLNLDIKGNDNVRLLGDGGNIILHADYTGKVGINLSGSATPLSALSVNGTITSGNFTAAGISGSIGDANTAEVGPGYINLARDDTADAAQIRFGKNGSVHSYLETRASGLGFVASAGHSFEGGLLAVGVSRAGLGTSNNRKLWVKGSAAFESQSGGTANPSLLTNTAIYLGPGSTRATSTTNPGTMGYADAGTGLLSGGIAWDHLRNYQTYGNIGYGERPHGWLGSELHSTPGYELSNMVMATREATASNSETKVAMRWNATGEITTPRNPAFHAYGTNMTNQTTEGNHGTWNEVHDRGANFAAGTSAKFTAPVDGIYAFYVQCNFNNNSTRPFYWRAVKNSTNMGIFYGDGSSETWTHISGFITVVMDKSDTFEWRYKGDPDEGSNWCQQGGYLIG